MMTFFEYMEAMQAAMPSPLWLNQATAASLATPNATDTKRAVERAVKRGRSAQPVDLRATVSPESEEAAKKGIMRLAAAQLSRGSGSTLGPGGYAGGPSRT